MLQTEEIGVVVNDAAVGRTKLSLVVILAVLVGVLLTVIAGGVFLHFRKGAAIDAEVLALRGELKKKTVVVEEMKAQNAVLAKHVKVLKGYSIASSLAVSEKAIDAGSDTAAPQVADNEPDVAAKKSASPPTAVAPKTRKASAGTQDCDLVGKSADQQVATLQRCVSLFDSRQRQPTASRGG